MRKLPVLVALLLLLCGCAGEETFETIADELVLPVMASPRQVAVELPEDAAAPVLETEDEQIYLCGDRELILQTLPAGDLSATIRELSGYSREALTVVETQWDAVTRYEFVWAATGEAGDRLGRSVILDDGQYHYCMTLLRDAEATSDRAVWDRVFSSFALA